MSRFIQTAKGYVNLDHVAKAIEVTDPETGHVMLRLIDARGEVLGIERESGTDLEEFTAPVVPAGPHAQAFLLYAHYDKKQGEYVGRLQRVPIIAWRISRRFGPTPIVANDIEADPVEILVIMPDGRVWSRGDVDFAGAISATNYFLPRLVAQLEARKAGINV
jgi:hypothetical protein